MARVAGFVFLRKQKVSGVQRNATSFHTVRLTERRANKQNGSKEKKRIAYLQFRFFATYGEVRVWLG